MKKIPLTQGKFALVDDEDYEWLMQWKWCYRPNKKRKQVYAYRRETVNGKRIVFLMHREILKPRRGLVIDHINNNGLDNRRKNIRICSYAQNSRNSEARKTKKYSKFKGVSRKRNHLGERVYWYARIHFGDTRLYLGSFKTEKEAHEAYKQAAMKYHGEFAKW